MMKRLALLLSLCALVPPVSLAETPEEKGLTIALEADRRDLGWGDSTNDMLMILRNKQGEESTRTIRNQTLEVQSDGDKGLGVFDDPADVKGTVQLTYSHKQGPDDQWLYLPALKRVKRIAAEDKSGSFMGSEFAFEDISSQEVEKYTYKYLRDEILNGQDCFVIERYPVAEYSGYKRQVVWLDKAEYRVQKVDYYDRKDSLLKTLTFMGYVKYLDKYWRPAEMFMENHQTGKSTLLKWSNYKFRVGLTDADFTQESLKRTR